MTARDSGGRFVGGMNDARVVMNPAAVPELLRTQVLPNMMLRAQRVRLAARAQINRGHVHSGLQDMPGMAAKAAKPTAPLADTLLQRVVSGTPLTVTVRVGSDSDHAYFVHEGTAPHIIRARNAKALFFYGASLGMFVLVPKDPPQNGFVNGKGILVSPKGYVDHPGTQPNRYLTDNLHLALI